MAVTFRTCLCLITRRARAEREVLLGYKKAGFGAGRWVGLGGHVEDGEDPADAAVREVAEESGLIIASSALTHQASLEFVFPARPAWDQTAEVFAAADFLGEPAESDELIPRWFAVDALPLDGMWDDARYWLPVVLAGGHVAARVTFADDCATVLSFDPDPRLAVPYRRSLAVLNF
jgi:8-oxo-dGTP diphosphatase